MLVYLYLSSFVRKDFNKGMTLIELVIALTLFVFISVSVMRMTKVTISYQKKISRNVTEVKIGRNVLHLLKKDIRNMFYTKDPYLRIYDKIFNTNSIFSWQKSNTKPSNISESGALPSGAQVSSDAQVPSDEQKALDHFGENQIMTHIPVGVETEGYGGLKGEKEEIAFFSLSHIRVQENQKASDQNGLVYYVKPCVSRYSNIKKPCLWRKSYLGGSPFVSDLNDDYKEFVLLEDIKKIVLSYYNTSSNEWISEWDTNEREYLPTAIRLEMEWKSQQGRAFQYNGIISMYKNILFDK